MRKIVLYEAFDGTQFDSEKDCVEYEQTEIFETEIEIIKSLQRLKAVELPETFQLYMKAKSLYKNTCVSKTKDIKKLETYSVYVKRKVQYNETINHYKKLQRSLKDVRSRIAAFKEKEK